MGRLCYPTQHRLDPSTLARKLSQCKAHLRQGFGVRRRVWHVFLPSGYKFYWALQVSRYKLSWSQKSVTVQDFNYGQMSVSGCSYHNKFILSAGAKAKSVTNNLPILSFLAAELFFLFCNILVNVYD
jgi:hypothetical protein